MPSELFSVVVPHRATDAGEEIRLGLEERGGVPSGELVLVEGSNPSRQRNRGVRVAAGDSIFFLDDDSVPVEGYFERGLEVLAEPGVDAVSGPRLGCADPDPACRIFEGMYASPLAMGPALPRYNRVGSPREASEDEVILASMAVDRNTFLDVDGFDDGLYPNEENEFVGRLDESGGDVRYDPRFAVRHCRVEPLPAFVHRFFRYGRGRASQMRVAERLRMLYLLPLLAFLGMSGVTGAALAGVLPLSVPVALAAAYAAAAVGDGVLRAVARGDRLYALSPLLVPLVHGGYALGTLAGIVSPYRRSGAVERVRQESLGAWSSRE